MTARFDCRERRLAWSIALAASILAALASCESKASERGAYAGGFRAINVELAGRRAYEVAVELASPGYEGRLAGSRGGRLAGDFLVRALEDAGLSVEVQEFDLVSPSMSGDAELAILAPDGEVETSFAFRVDFREVTRGGFEGGEATGPLALRRYPDEQPSPGAIALVASAFYDPDGGAAWADAGYAALIVELAPGAVATRTAYPGPAFDATFAPREGCPIVGVTSRAYRELAAAAESGRFIRLSSPLDFVLAKGRNVIARYDGDGGDFDPEFALSAHYDHLGVESGGGYYPGALDNASGCGIVLALAEALAASGAAIDAAFLFFDGEESGLRGSRHFAYHPSFGLPGVLAVNIDMAGSSGDVPISLLSDGSDGDASETMRAALARVGVETHPGEHAYASDHLPLAGAGAIAFSICEYDTERYHTTGDASEVSLDSGDIARLVEAIAGALSLVPGD
jgi:hypothetical protein